MAKQKLKKIPGLDPIDLKKKQEKERQKQVKKIKKEKERQEIRENIKNKYQDLNYKKLIVIAIIIVLVIALFIKISKTKITNIEVNGNNILSEQEIIDLAGIRNYPNSLAHSSKNMKKKLEKNIYINSVKVKKSNLLKKVTITIKENRPLVFYAPENKTMLANGNYTTDTFNVPTLVNQVPEDILKKFITNLDIVNDEILIRINEIKYIPNEVDDSLFMFSMNDQNYVYVNNNTLKKLNEYLSMLKTFNNKKGILHLDSGDYFEIMPEKVEEDEEIDSSGEEEEE